MAEAGQCLPNGAKCTENSVPWCCSLFCYRQVAWPVDFAGIDNCLNVDIYFKLEAAENNLESITRGDGMI